MLQRKGEQGKEVGVQSIFTRTFGAAPSDIKFTGDRVRHHIYVSWWG